MTIDNEEIRKKTTKKGLWFVYLILNSDELSEESNLQEEISKSCLSFRCSFDLSLVDLADGFKLIEAILMHQESTVSVGLAVNANVIFMRVRMQVLDTICGEEDF